MELVIAALPQLAVQRRTEERGRRPAQEAANRRPVAWSESELTSHERNQRGFCVPRIQERDQEDQDSEFSLFEVEEIGQQPWGKRNFQRYWHQEQEERMQDYKMKIDIPMFSGKLDLEAFLDWIKSVESFFQYMNTPDSKKVKLVSFKLKSGASAWWDQIQTNRH